VPRREAKDQSDTHLNAQNRLQEIPSHDPRNEKILRHDQLAELIPQKNDD